jgi:hypothetical protein
MMDEIENKANILLSEATDSYHNTIKHFGSNWVLSAHDSIKAWLRGYNANEHNNKLYNKALELLEITEIY